MRRGWALRVGAAAAVAISVVVVASPVWATSERLSASPNHGTAHASFMARYEIADPDVCDRYSVVFLWDDDAANDAPGTPMQLVSGRCYAQELVTAPQGASEGRHLVGAEVWDIVANGHRARITVPFTIDPDPVFPAASGSAPLNVGSTPSAGPQPPSAQAAHLAGPDSRTAHPIAAPAATPGAPPPISVPPPSGLPPRPQGMGLALLLLGMLVGSGIFGGLGRGLIARLRPASSEASRPDQDLASPSASRTKAKTKASSFRSS